MKTVIRIFSLFILSIFILFLFFYIFLVYPHDRRVKTVNIESKPLVKTKILVYNFVEKLPQAKIITGDIASLLQKVKSYPYLNANPYFHSHQLNLHVSLGWFPLKAEHKNAIYSPIPTILEYSLILPENPVLEFDYGIISTIDKLKQKSAVFSVSIIDQKNVSHLVFEDKVNPLDAYPWHYSNSFYKNFYKYLNVNLEDREGKWYQAVLDLKFFSGQKVKIRFSTTNLDNTLAHAFWANPRLYQWKEASLLPEFYNLVLIVVDTLRSDHIDVNGQSVGLTPNINLLAKRGVNFLSCFANGNMTKQSVSALFTSRYPQELGSIAFEYHSDEKSKSEFYRKKIPTLASILKQEGYFTKAIGCMGLLCDGIGYGTDWDFDDVSIIEQSNYEPPQITYEGIRWLSENQDKKFFLLLYYGGAHGPYRPPLRFLKQGYERKFFNLGDWYRIFYRGEVAYADYYVGIVLDTLHKLDLTEKTLIVLCSDHGDTFKKYLVESNKKNKMKEVILYDHGVSLTDDEIKVPLIISLPGKLPENKTITISVQLLDVVPTVLEILGINRSYYFQGASLYPIVKVEKEQSSRIIFSYGRHNYGIRVNGQYKYIYNFDTYSKKNMRRVVEKEELYNLKNDPMEDINIAYSNQSILLKMRELVEKFVPLFEETQLAFYNVGKVPISGKIKIDGRIKSCQKQNSSNHMKLKQNEVEFGITADDIITFQTDPNQAEFSLELKLAGRKINLSEILVSQLGLPLLNKETDKISKEDFLYLKGMVQPLPQEKNLMICLGRLPIGIQLGKEQVGLPQGLKTMLEEWGYINR